MDISKKQRSAFHSLLPAVGALSVLTGIGAFLVVGFASATGHVPTFARMLTPQAGHRVLQGNALRVQVQMKFLRTDPVVCQEWFLDGRSLTRADWEQSQSPDESEVLC